MDHRGTCKGACERFRATKPKTGSRYEAGQARCQMCEVWIDRRGAHMQDGSPALREDAAWYCNCCRYRLRRTPKKSVHKPKARGRQGAGPDLSHFSRHRARMMAGLGRAIAQKTIGGSAAPLDRLLARGMRTADIEYEFESEIMKILDAAYSDLPNAISLVAEFETIKYMLGRVPTKAEIGSASKFGPEQYEKEFASWEHMLDKLGYDPWYRKGPGRVPESPGSDADRGRLKAILEEKLRGEPLIAGLFEKIDSQMDTMDEGDILEAARAVPD